jgi:hypothetical protein
VIKVINVPIMNASTLPESGYSAITHSFVPTSVSNWVKPENVSVAHEYGIRSSMEEKYEADMTH